MLMKIALAHKWRTACFMDSLARDADAFKCFPITFNHFWLPSVRLTTSLKLLPFY